MAIYQVHGNFPKVHSFLRLERVFEKADNIIRITWDHGLTSHLKEGPHVVSPSGLNL